MQNNNTTLKNKNASQLAADEWHEAGFKVFGLYSHKDGVCDCGFSGCQAIGKHPLTSNWQFCPNWSDSQMFHGHEMNQFTSGYGVLLENLFVIDIDARNGGVKSYETLLAQYPEIAGSGLVVETGSGNGSKHLYFTLPLVDGKPAPLLSKHEDFPGIDFKSSGFVVGAGSTHASGRLYQAVIGSPYDITEAPATLLELLEKKDSYRIKSSSGSTADITDETLESMVSHISNDGRDYEKFIRIGMAIHHTTGGTREDLWHDWAKKSDCYDPRGMDKKWHSFGKGATLATAGTLIYYAEQSGWKWPVEFNSDMSWASAPAPGEPIDITGIDILRPPGLVGKITEWINSQCLFPRETLAVAAALTCVSNAAGMRYKDDLDGTTPNLFAFCVAGSATGKEAVLKSFNELMRAAGLSPAVYGGIKSEQEIYRNMTRHQGVFYAIDELGEQLSKITNAAKKGNASYLEGIVGTLMSAYSKANSHMLITGDLKETVRESIHKERKGLQKLLDDGVDKNKAEVLEKKLARIDKKLDSLDMGIDAPYVSILGFTTPDKFNSLMDYELATNGFMGRALIFQELNDNPKRKPRGKTKRSPVPDDIKAALQMLYAPGYSEGSLPDCIECIGDKVAMQTTPEAAVLLDRVGEGFWELAEDHKQATGLSAIPRRAYEQVAKISMVLAMPEGLRTVEHVTWAYALIKRDIEKKLRLANSNSADDRQNALASLIMSAVTAEHGETKTRLKRLCRKYPGGDVDRVLAIMVEKEILKLELIGEGKRKAETYFDNTEK